jgi:hypothetical protein
MLHLFFCACSGFGSSPCEQYSCFRGGDPQRRARQAASDFNAEMDKWAIVGKGQDLILAAEKVGNACQVTAFESQLCRSLKKESGPSQKEAVTKYFSKYATVLSTDVLPQLWSAGQLVLKGST